MKLSRSRLLATCFCTWLAAHQPLAAKASAEILAESPNVGVKVAIILPRGGTIVSRESTERGRSAVVKIDADEPAHGIIVQLRDAVDRALWTHDFGYNLSASPGCQITVDIAEAHRAVLVHYAGYKWDHDHRLILLPRPASPPGGIAASEYRGAAHDILPHVQAHPAFAGHPYWITPVRFIEEGVLFGCTPLSRTEGAAHPFDQEAAGFTVRARIDLNGAVEPLEITKER